VNPQKEAVLTTSSAFPSNAVSGNGSPSIDVNENAKAPASRAAATGGATVNVSAQIAGAKVAKTLDLDRFPDIASPSFQIVRVGKIGDGTTSSSTWLRVRSNAGSNCCDGVITLRRTRVHRSSPGISRRRTNTFARHNDRTEPQTR
jgi:hypothetical protein